MPTPIQWLAGTQTNTGTAANEFQSTPQIIGLSNGNFLVAWEESGTTGVGTSAGLDIVGKIYDALGNVVVDSFHINGAGFFVDDEFDFSIAATNDGGFIMVYLDDSISIVDSTQIIWSRHDSTGAQTNTAFIASENVAADSLGNPQVSVNLLTNESYVSYTDNVGGNSNISGVLVSATGSVGTEFGFALNGAGFDGEGTLAILTGGNVVSVYREDFGGSIRVAARITDAAGISISTPLISAGVGLEVDVAALSDGNWVAVWTEGNNINYRVYGPTGTAITGVLTAAGTADNENEPAVIGLPQGGFAIVWDNDTDNTLEGQLYTNAGAVDGSVFAAAIGNPTSIDLGVTADGRILITWISINSGSEVFHSIWDPRGATISAYDYDNASRSFVNNTGPVTGNSLNNTITDNTGSNGVLIGGDGNDIFFGQDGINGDTFNGGAGIDTLNNSAVNLTSQVTVNLATGTIDVNGGGNIETLISIENYIGGGSETIIGSDGNNVLTGGVGNNTISGGFGNDTLNGGDGNDLLTGGSGLDTVNGGNGDDIIFFTSGHFYDNINGGAGTDTLDASAAGQALTIDLRAETLSGYGSATQAISIERVIGTAFNDTIRSGGFDTFVDAGGGDDLVFAVNGLPETLDGGAGVDTLDTTDFDGDYVIDLTTGLTNFSGELFTNFENLVSGAGDDTITGTSGNNNIQTNGGNDVVNAGDGNDTVNGGDGNDTLNGEFGDDILIGGNGNDTIDGGSGIDQMFGGDGDDVLIGDTTGEILDGGIGRDRADYSALSGGAGTSYYWDLGTGFRGFTSFTGPVDITFTSIEDFAGFDGNDQVRGTGDANRIWGNAGDDTLRGLAGNDTLDGGDGNDYLDGGIGADTMIGGAGNDIYIVDNIGDVVTELAAGGTDEVRTTVNNYTLGANVENLRLQGAAVVGTGNALDNTINAGAGPATLNGMGGNDILNGSGNGDTLNGGSGDDFLFGRNGNDTLFGGTGNDTMRGGTGSDTMYGEDGNDLMFGDEGQDTLFGGAGDDDLRGGIQNDTLYGGDGNDLLRGDDGNDNLYGGAGRDFFTGGAGNDNFYFQDGDFVGTGLTLATADRIVDFQDGFDRIRLNLIDANVNVAGDQAFTFIGTGAFTNVAGQLRYQISGTNTLVFGDTNGDGVADFAIALTGAYALDITDFGL